MHDVSSFQLLAATVPQAMMPARALECICQAKETALLQAESKLTEGEGSCGCCTLCMYTEKKRESVCVCVSQIAGRYINT